MPQLAKQMLPEELKKSDLKKIFDETKSGKISAGVVGSPEAPLYVKDEEKPVMTPEEEVEARVLRNLLLRWIDPPKLSEKSKPEDDKRMLSRKVQGQSLQDLRRFFDIDLPDDAVYALRRKYQDISP